MFRQYALCVTVLLLINVSGIKCFNVTSPSIEGVIFNGTFNATVLTRKENTVDLKGDSGVPQITEIFIGDGCPTGYGRAQDNTCQLIIE